MDKVKTMARIHDLNVSIRTAMIVLVILFMTSALTVAQSTLQESGNPVLPFVHDQNVTVTVNFDPSPHNVSDDEPSPAAIHSSGTGGAWDDPSTWDANRIPTQHDTVIVVSGALVTMSGDTQREAGKLLIEEEAELRGLDNARLAVYLDLVNEGELTHQFDSDQFFVGVHGKIVNNGAIQTMETIADTQVIIVQTHRNIVNTGIWRGLIETHGDAIRNIDLRSADAVLVNRTSELEIAGDNYIPIPMVINEDARLVVPSNARLYSNNFLSLVAEARHFLDSRGQIILENEGTQIPGYGMSVLAEDSIHARIISYGKQVPPTFALANRRWFRFEYINGSENTSNGSENTSFRQLQIEFTDVDLAGVSPEDLEVFYSSDGGDTWQQISNDENRFRNLEMFDAIGVGSLIVQNPPGYGDYVLSSGEPYTVRPVVGFYLNTLPQIRVGGPPHNATLTYYNAGNTPVSDGLLQINTGGGVYIDRIIPLDSRGHPAEGMEMGIEDFAFERDSTDALLYTPPLGPGEVRRIRLVLQAIPVGPLVGENEIANVPLAFVGGTFVVGIFTDYVKDIVTSGIEEVIADPCANRSSFQDKMKTAFDKTDEKWNPFGNSEAPYLSVANNGANAMTEGMFDKLKSGMSKAGIVTHVHDVGKAVTDGFDRYEQNTGRSIYQPINCDPDEPAPPFPEPDRRNVNKDLEPVTSWDPNQKVGPTGAGSGEFMAEIGRFFYRIDFENLEEATAPAYRVIIVDTLSDVYDPTTVQLEGESHPGFEFSQNDHVLRWEIEGIELVPNIDPPEGEGWVAFSVDAVAGLESGTIFENRATIVFDMNPAIVTNTHVNILDNLEPLTQMRSLPEEVETDTLTIYFDSDDGPNGSGVDNILVFGSHNGGGVKQMAVSRTDQARIPVKPGHWSFYALASDVVGNSEITKPESVTTTVITPTAREDGLLKPFSWELGGNYPNPFNPATVIPYSLQSEGEVTIRLYDVLGRRVLTVDAGLHQPGQYFRELDLSRMASGMYVYEIRVQGTGELLFRDARKMVLVK